MGCWNKTCGLTNLYIPGGTEVYVFVLEQNLFAYRNSYTSYCWKPVMLTFESTYNDYGGGKNSKGVAFPLIMDSIKSLLVEKEVGCNKCHDIPIKKDEFGEQLFFDSVHEQRLYIKYPHTSIEVKVDFVMFRKDVVDYIIQHRNIRQYDIHKNGYITYSFKDILNDIPYLIDSLKRWYTKNLSMSVTDLISGGPNLAGKYIRNNNSNYSNIINISDTLRNIVLNGDQQQTVDFLVSYIKAVFIDEYMDSVRKLWMPAGFEGSQNQDPDDYKLLMNATQAAILK